MEKLELMIGDEVLQVPEEITIGIYQEFQKNPEKYKDPLRIISMYTGLTMRELKNMDVESVKLIEYFISDKLVLPDKNELVMTFFQDGIEYGLENDWSKLPFGGWVDMEVYSAGNIYENIDKIMAVLYRPVISHDKKDPMKYTIAPYDSEEILERANIMRLVPARYWLGVSLFFSQIVSIYITNIRASLVQTMKLQKATMRGWKILPKFLRKRLPLDSILPSYTDSQKKMLQKLQR